MDGRVRFTAPAGGVMTVEVGAVTGELEVWLTDGRAKISYVGALDEYTVKGAKPTPEMSTSDVAEVLRRDPGLDDFGNAQAAVLV